MANKKIRAFKKLAKINARRLKMFINKLATQHKKNVLDRHFVQMDKEVWQETNCLECSHCCRFMTPTFTKQDIKRIASYFKLDEQVFKQKWLIKEKGSGDWLNIKRPCQFLNTQTNMCNIYAIRPKDCADFPHHHKKHLIDYAPMLKQNVDYCPASNLLIEKMYALYKK